MSDLTPVSTTLHATACSRPCLADFRLRRSGATTWMTTHLNRAPAALPLRAAVRGLSPATRYEYQSCVNRPHGARMTCTGPDGTAATTWAFTTFPLQGGAVWRENQHPGDSLWQAPLAPELAIDGYASQTSLAPGALLNLHVSAPGARYRVEIERLGFYGGLGGRRVACIPSCRGSEPGVAQPSPGSPDPGTGFLAAGWSVTDTIRLPARLTSGYYEARLVITSRPHRGRSNPVWFVVRAAPARARTSVLVVVPVNTAQAYNPWPTLLTPAGTPLLQRGGRSLYAFNSSGHQAANHVSFDRPLPHLWNTPRYVDLPLVRYLESQGYDISYVTEDDLDANPRLLRGHRLVVVMGHSEYWSKRIRDGYETARDAGVNLAFLGANDGFWQIRLTGGRRTIVAYKEQARALDPATTSDPAELTSQFRALTPPRPECALIGVQYADDPRVPAGGSYAYSVVPRSLRSPWLTGTGLTARTTIPDVVGYEWDTIHPGCPSQPVTRLFHWQRTLRPGVVASADSVIYTAPSGARVFAAGTLQFVQALSGSPAPGAWGLQSFTRRLLDRLAGLSPKLRPARAA